MSNSNAELSVRRRRTPPLPIRAKRMSLSKQADKQRKSAGHCHREPIEKPQETQLSHGPNTRAACAKM
jgi:hypothetical protein